MGERHGKNGSTESEYLATVDANMTKLVKLANLNRLCSITGYSYWLAVREANWLAQYMGYTVDRWLDWIIHKLEMGHPWSITRVIAVILQEDKE